jgi:undecaprenyl diphosphate synthase
MAKLSEETKKLSQSVKDGGLRHIAFIMDGNGRWAQKRGLPRKVGHKHGTEAFKRVIEHCGHLGIECITVYAFSTENWKRPKDEVDSIMKLLESYLDGKYPEEVSVKFIGDISPLSDSLKATIKRAETQTSGRPVRVNVAVNYGSRAEITHAVNDLISQGRVSVTEEDITSHLYTGDCPELDLVVRTGGDIRISNFLLWQAAYAELYFTDTLWPDLSDEDIDNAVKTFLSRKRRFGGLDKDAK